MCVVIIFERSRVYNLKVMCLLFPIFERSCCLYLKGHVDPGEDDLTTAYRETWEESGIKKVCITISIKKIP